MKRLVKASRPLLPFRTSTIPRQHPSRPFHVSATLQIVKPYLLADIGEGITECQVIQWFVRPGARVEQFDKICEVQSDKATVEITSRFDGVIKKLYYEADDVARVGKPLVDIDIQGEISEQDQAVIDSPGEQAPESSGEVLEKPPSHPSETSKPDDHDSELLDELDQPQKPPPGKYATLATPAVRHILKQLNIDITDVQGTGKEGRVLKEDVQKYAASKGKEKGAPATTAPTSAPMAGDRVVPLTPIQKQMFKTMTRSLTIPHFLYTDTVDFTALNAVRRKLNANASSNRPTTKLSALPFIIKAVSLALESYPSLNAYLDTSSPDKPQLIHKSQHDIGIAIDSPNGLLVPVVRHVQAQSISSLTAEIARLGTLARDGKLSTNEMSGATFTVSNIGSIGGTAVAPVIVAPQVGILGVGRTRPVPAFGENGELVRKDECVFSWSADHRVIDGATAARCADEVRRYLEDVEAMLVRLK